MTIAHNDASTRDSVQADTKTVPDTTTFKDQGGMFEAPPPPMDAPIIKQDAQADAGVKGDAEVSEAGPLDTGTTDVKTVPDALVFKDQGGMFEAPPPPMDAPIGKKD